MTDEARRQAAREVMAGRIDEACFSCRNWSPCAVTPRTTSLVRYGDCRRGYGVTTEEDRCEMWSMVRLVG